jgi:hypothetical protein
MIRRGDSVRFRPDSERARDFDIGSDKVGIVDAVFDDDRANVNFGAAGYQSGAVIGDLMPDLDPQKSLR